MKCKICNEEQTIRSMAMHLKWSHSIKTEEYVSQYGEFRPKNINHNQVKSTSNIECKICKEPMMHNRQLMYHITKKHKEITQEQYIVKYNFNNIHPTCKCGCGKETEFIRYGEDTSGNEWFRSYIKGHWDWIVPGYNSHSEVTKELIRNISKQRANKEIEIYGHQLMHTPEVLTKIREKKKEKYIDRLKNEFNVILTNSKDLYTHTRSNRIYKFKCIGCNTEWQQKTRIPNCQKCNPPSHLEVSNEEKELREYIQSIYKESIMFNNTQIITPYEIDIYLPDINLAIEYNGLYWHSENRGKHETYHLNKTQMCEQHGINLIHIFSDEWINKKEIVKSRLSNILKQTSNKIYARKCKIKEIDTKTKSVFMDLNHIQGNDKSKIKLGLYYNKELVSVMTFGVPRVAIGSKNKTNGNYELMRFYNKLNTNVIGGASKLLQYFIKMYKPNKIYSFADYRWSNINNNIYKTLGFNQVSISSPGYWYTKKYDIRYHRFGFNKGRLKQLGFDITKTEKEIMKENGYDKIWDCGVIRYELNFSIKGT